MNDSNWTVETLKEYIEKLLIEKDKAINLALAAAKEAVLVAEANAEKWRLNANEWRGAMEDRERKFLQKEEFLSYKEATERALSREKTISDVSTGRSSGMMALWAIIAGVIAIVISVVSFIIKF